MKRVLQSILGVIAMVGLAVAVIWLVRSASGRQDLMAQVTAQPIETEEIQATGTPTSAPDNQNNSSEPTATPVIILPEGTSPPIPTPFTPTATPINPKEELIIELKSLAGQLAISPNDKELAFVQFSLDESQDQLWKFDLVSKQLTKLSELGGIPKWSPDGQTLSFLRRYWDDSDSTEAKAEIRVVTSDGKNEKVLIKRNLSQVLDYYWSTSDEVSLISPKSITNISLKSGAIKEIDLALPKNKNNSLKAYGSPKNFVVLNEDSQIRVIRYNDGKDVIIQSPPTRQMVSNEIDASKTITPYQQSIGEINISPNNQQIAYTTIDGPLQELWVTDLEGKSQRKLYELPRGGNIVIPQWSTDSKFLVIGHHPTGTYYGSSYELTLIEVETGQVTDLNVDNVSEGLVWSHDGQWLYYTREILIEAPEKYNVTLYRFRVGQ